MSTRSLCISLVGAWFATMAWAQSPATLPPVPARFPAADAPAAPMIRQADDPPATGLFASGTFARVAGIWREPAADTVLQPESCSRQGPGRCWINNELLMWWIQGMSLPPLVSTSPPGTPAAQAGVIGQPGTTTLFGPGVVDNSLRFGWRLTVGGWLDDERRFSVEAQFLMLANGGTNFSAASDGTPGSPILARPVFNGLTNARAAEPIAIPGVSNGSIYIATSTSGLIGAGLSVHENFCRYDDVGSAWRVRFGSLFGYRYLRLADHLEIDDSVNAAIALNGLPAGSQMLRFDRFDSANNFHGVDLGLTGDIECGPWSLGLLSKVAAGFNNSASYVSGIRVVNGVPAAGGLLAQQTNSVRFTHIQATAVPELGFSLGYAITPNLKVHANYSFLYWFNVVRAANQVDVGIDPAFLAQAGPAGNAIIRPAVSLDMRDIWMQGISVGLEWKY